MLNESVSFGRLRRLLTAFAATLITGVSTASGQELEPRAYSVSPVGVNIIVVTNNFSGGDLNFDPTLPISEAAAPVNTTAFAYLRAVSFLGRSANIGIC